MELQFQEKGEQEIINVDMKDYYFLIQDRYNYFLGYENVGVIKKLNPVIEKIQKVVKNKEVLELACGPGFWSKHVNTTAKSLLCTDINNHKLGNINFEQVDNYNFPKFNKKFDICFAVDWFCHLDKRVIKTHLKSIYCRLKKNGQIVFCDQMEGMQLNGLYFGNDNKDDFGNNISFRFINNKKFNIIKNFYTDDEYKEFFGKKIEILKFIESNRILIIS